jgi:hypothetical protein
MAGQNAPNLADFCKNMAVFQLAKVPLIIFADSEKLNGDAFLSISRWNCVVFQCDKKAARVN